jgi:DNA invertase Pin-like site-specific DNA recombinase
MDQGILEEIITPTQTIRNTPNDKFLFSILCGQAKLENDNRGINSKRGMGTKANMGWYPSPAPLGYKNTPDKKKGFKIIEVDEERFHLVQKLFYEILSGKQVIDVYKEATEIWKLTSGSGKIISRSTFYNLLNKPFYYG